MVPAALPTALPRSIQSLGAGGGGREGKGGRRRLPSQKLAQPHPLQQPRSDDLDGKSLLLKYSVENKRDELARDENGVKRRAPALHPPPPGRPLSAGLTLGFHLLPGVNSVESHVSRKVEVGKKG